jgi:hypothetical protein
VTQHISALTVGSWYTIRLLIDASGQYMVWLFAQGSSPGEPSLIGQHSDFATGGALASGKTGIYDANNSSTPITRNYDNFAAWVPTSDAVLFAGQTAQLRHDGMIRLDAGGAAYGPISQVIGDLPRLPPSGLESRTVEVFLLGSRGDLDQLPDTGIDDISAQIKYRPSYLFRP